METTKKNDFVEIEFVGKIKDTGEIFDTNIKEQAEKINPDMESTPLIVCIGQGMLVKGFDKALEGRETGKKYNIHLTPEESFGLRNPKLIRIIPMRAFKDKNFNPVPGAVIALDNALAKIITASSGRVIVDFNNPLAGRDIEYEFKIKREVSDENEKVDALQVFFFKQKFPFSIKNNKILFQKQAGQIIKIFSVKFKEILGKEIEIEDKETKETEKAKEVVDTKHIKPK